MSRIIALATAGAVAAFAVTPAAAESWSRFSASDRTIYLIDLDSLTPTDGVITVRMARAPAHGAAADLSHEIEEVLVRCADGQSRAGETVAYGPDGAETDRYADEAPWEPTSKAGLYGSVAEMACGNMRPSGAPSPTIAAFIAEGRGG